MKLPFTGVIRRNGASCIVTIPSAYIANNLLKEGGKYDFMIWTLKKDKEEEGSPQ